LAFNEWTRQQLLWMRLAKLIYLAIPRPKPTSQEDISSCQQAQVTASTAFREYILTLFPELTDAQVDKESELADFLKQFATKPFELRITEDPRGNMDVSLKR
jgi:hypothetical protein